MDEDEKKAPPLDGPLAEAVEVINKLLALCAKHSPKLRRAALSIASGIPLPPKRKRGRPKVVTDEAVQRHFATALELYAQKDGRVGAKTRLAKALAEAETDPKSRARRSEVKKRTLARQNDLSELRPEVLVAMAYYVRCILAGESVEKAKARLMAAVVDGDDEAARECAEIVRDLLLASSHRKSRK
jgi:hypothetical protein